MKWIYDIEIYPNYFCVTFLNLETDEKVIFEIDDEKGINDTKALKNFLRNIWVIGYNNLTFDNIICNYIIKENPTVSEIYEFAQELIKRDFNELYEQIKKYKYNNDYQSVDLMRLLFSKALRVGLKELEVTMNYPNVQELPYKYDTYLTKEQKKEVLDYNLNDCLATKELCKICLPALELRKAIKDEFGLDCFSKDGVRTGVDLLFKLYCDKTEDDPKYVKELRTFRSSIKLGDIISDRVFFKSKQFSELLTTLKNTTIVGTKGVLDYKVLYGGVLHVFGTGGIHSKDNPGIVQPNEDEIYRDADVASLYPSIEILYGFKPRHLKPVFLDIYGGLKQDRIAAKRAGRMLISDTYKLALNGEYGNLINMYSWLYDPQAAMGITLNGQLFLSMLSEQMTDAGIKVDSINTDGITCIIPKSKIEEYDRICKEWQELTGLELEFADYKKVMRRDVNTYLAMYTNGKVKEKGDFLTKPVLGKGYDKPIIAIAIKEYFVNGTPVEQTIKNHQNIYDFCMMKKIDKKYKSWWNGKEQQRINRYYVSNKGAYLYKQKTSDIGTYGKVTMANEHGGFDTVSYKKGTMENMLKGFAVQIFNKFEQKEMKDYHINYNYYISETKAILHEVESKQLDLFL